MAGSDILPQYGVAWIQPDGSRLYFILIDTTVKETIRALPELTAEKIINKGDASYIMKLARELLNDPTAGPEHHHIMLLMAADKKAKDTLQKNIFHFWEKLHQSFPKAMISLVPFHLEKFRLSVVRLTRRPLILNPSPSLN